MGANETTAYGFGGMDSTRMAILDWLKLSGSVEKNESVRLKMRCAVDASSLRMNSTGHFVCRQTRVQLVPRKTCSLRLATPMNESYENV